MKVTIQAGSSHEAMALVPEVETMFAEGATITILENDYMVETDSLEIHPGSHSLTIT